MRAIVLGVVVGLMVAGLAQGAAAQDSGGAQPPAENAQTNNSPPPPAWSTTCSGATRSSVSDCAIEQRVFLSQTGQLFGAMTIRVPADTRAPVMMLQLPLGLFLPAGVSLAVDGGAGETLPIQTCEASGCYIGSALSPTLLAAMKKGKQLVVTFQNTQKNAIAMPISLNGFTAAFASIE